MYVRVSNTDIYTHIYIIHRYDVLIYQYIRVNVKDLIYPRVYGTVLHCGAGFGSISEGLRGSSYDAWRLYPLPGSKFRTQTWGCFEVKFTAIAYLSNPFRPWVGQPQVLLCHYVSK